MTTLTEPQILMGCVTYLGLFLLVLPLIQALIPNRKHRIWAVLDVTYMVRATLVLSLILLFLFIKENSKATVFAVTWVSILSFDIKIELMYDAYAILFIPVALYVTWSIMDFASWYMESDPQLNKFFLYLLTFLVSMIILVTAGNLFQLFIGWEGVGIMSFLLIGWWGGRADANTAALQAVMYNRIADMGLILSIGSIAACVGGWNLEHIYETAKEHNLTLPLLGFVIAAAGKSAQFGFHPWLPSAMEGPTPVSALLHSSTMVVAGIFLLVRVSPIMQNNPTISTICLCVGALTTLFTAACALTQNDLKKIIAFSTSSQLGLMMVTIGLNQPGLAFLHICTHAFFKAMLFLCSGVLIHSLNNEQDIRKMRGLHFLMPFTSNCITIGSLALAGTPFLSGFFSKDAIIEALNTSYLNSWALALTLVATAFTAVYSLRIAYFVQVGYPLFTTNPSISEKDPKVYKPLKRLVWGSILAGMLITLNVDMPSTSTMTMPFLTKITALLVTLAGLFIARELATLANNQHKPTPDSQWYRFSNMLGYFPPIFHKYIPMSVFVFAQKVCTLILDQTWLEKFGPKAIWAAVTDPTQKDFSDMTVMEILQRILLLVAIFAFFYVYAY